MATTTTNPHTVALVAHREVCAYCTAGAPCAQADRMARLEAEHEATTTPRTTTARDDYAATDVLDLALGDVVRRTNENYAGAPVGVVVAIHHPADGGDPWATVQMGDDQWGGTGTAWTRLPADVALESRPAMTGAERRVYGVLAPATAKTPAEMKREMPGAVPVATVRVILGRLEAKGYARPAPEAADGRNTTPWVSIAPTTTEGGAR